MKLGLVTCAALPLLYESDKALIPLLAPYNIEGSPVIWDDPYVDWQEFDSLLIRNTWDYYEKYPSFIRWLDMLERIDMIVLNPISTIRTNIHKKYLKTLEKNGIPIVPTVWIDHNHGDLENAVNHTSWNVNIIKPCISAGSFETLKFDKNESQHVIEKYQHLHKDTDLMIQPYLDEITTHGEVSLVYFSGEYSHAVRKLPKEGDFRIQRQFGGVYSPITPDQQLIEHGANILQIFDRDHLYGRVDMIEKNGQYLVMEVEMIEPDLYFRVFPDLIHTFIRAIAKSLGHSLTK